MTKAKGPNDGRNSTSNPAVSKYAGLDSGHGGVEISWAEVSGPLIKSALAAATDDGCALIFSKTSDGGALSLTLLAGTQRIKKYAKSVELAQSMLEEITATARS